MVVVLEGGSVIDMPWLDSVPAVVMAWYPGQRGGPALGKLLWGQANFSGKLPFTWAKSVDQYDTWNGDGTTKFDYHVGYSWFDYKSRDRCSRSDTASPTRRSSTASCSSGAAT